MFVQAGKNRALLQLSSGIKVKYTGQQTENKITSGYSQ
jgi:hypothetical protein